MLNERKNSQNNMVIAIDEVDMENENQPEINNYSMMNFFSTLADPYNPDFEINNPSIDLDVYVSGFTGLMRIKRLIFLAEHCPLLRIDALRLSLNYIMETYNTQLYITVHKQMTDAFSKL